MIFVRTFMARTLIFIELISYFLICSLVSLCPSKKFQKVTYSLILLHFVPKRQLRIDAVLGASSLSFLGDIPISLKVRDDAPGGLLSDTYGQRDFPSGDSRLLSNQAKH